MTSAADRELKGIEKMLAGFLKDIPARNRDIISRRFGLGGKKETLESIGASYSITRERVRQLEEFSMAQLAKAIDKSKEFERAISLVKNLLAKSGGAMAEDELFESFGVSRPGTGALAVLLTLADNQLVRSAEDDECKAFWALTPEHAENLRKSVRSLMDAFEKSKKLVPTEEVAQFASRQGVMSGDGVPDSKYLETVLSVAKVIGTNVFHQTGLTHWPQVRPRGVRDKAYLVLQKAKEPQHFTNIARLINTASFKDKKRVNVQTVHNELIKDDRFVLVGRGLYALSEWGYRPGTVKEVLTDILKSTKNPLSRAELIAKVKDVRMVKENTILLNLQDSRSFVRRDDGTYGLRKA